MGAVSDPPRRGTLEWTPPCVKADPAAEKSEAYTGSMVHVTLVLTALRAFSRSEGQSARHRKQVVRMGCAVAGSPG